MTAEPDDLPQRVQNVLDNYEQDGWISTGYVLITAAVHPDHDLDGTTGYGYIVAPNQPVHATRGLIDLAADHYAN